MPTVILKLVEMPNKADKDSIDPKEASDYQKLLLTGGIEALWVLPGHVVAVLQNSPTSFWVFLEVNI